MKSGQKVRTRGLAKTLWAYEAWMLPRAPISRVEACLQELSLLANTAELLAPARSLQGTTNPRKSAITHDVLCDYSIL